MCSTGERLERLGLAIDQLAAETDSETAADTQKPGDAAQPPDTKGDGQASRLAELWAMLAELDPELARRLPDYLR